MIVNWLKMWGKKEPPEDYEDFLYVWIEKHGFDYDNLEEVYEIILHAFKEIIV